MEKGSKQSYTSQTSKKILNLLAKGENLADSFISTEILHESEWRPFLLCFERTGNMRPCLKLALEEDRRRKDWKDAIIRSILYPSIIVFISLACIVFLYLRGIPLMRETGFIHDSSVIEKMNTGIAVSAIVLITSSASLFFTSKYILTDRKRKQAFWSTLNILAAEDIPLDSCFYLCETSTGIPYECDSDLYFFNSTKLDPYTNAILQSARLTGDFPGAFKAIAMYHTENLTSLYSFFSGLMEPAGILIAGIIVLILSLTVFLPLFNALGGIN